MFFRSGDIFCFTERSTIGGSKYREAMDVYDVREWEECKDSRDCCLVCLDVSELMPWFLYGDFELSLLPNIFNSLT